LIFRLNIFTTMDSSISQRYRVISIKERIHFVHVALDKIDSRTLTEALQTLMLKVCAELIKILK